MTNNPPSDEEFEQQYRKTIREVVKDLQTSNHPLAAGAVALGRSSIAKSEERSRKGGKR
jgi:hypothetical protein